MFAVVKTGGKQYRVAEGDVIKVEKLDGEAGKNITLDQVLMVGDDKGVKVGEPLVAGAKVTFEVLEQKKDKKIIVFKKKRRQNYRRKKGHRQEITVLRVTKIAGAAAKKAAAKKTEEAAAE
jgi:large subunit ribosomal protein L21